MDISELIEAKVDIFPIIRKFMNFVITIFMQRFPSTEFLALQHREYGKTFSLISSLIKFRVIWDSLQ